MTFPLRSKEIEWQGSQWFHNLALVQIVGYVNCRTNPEVLPVSWLSRCKLTWGYFLLDKLRRPKGHFASSCSCIVSPHIQLTVIIHAIITPAKNQRICLYHTSTWFCELVYNSVHPRAVSEKKHMIVCLIMARSCSCWLISEVFNLGWVQNTLILKYYTAIVADWRIGEYWAAGGRQDSHAATLTHCFVKKEERGISHFYWMSFYFSLRENAAK